MKKHLTVCLSLLFFSFKIYSQSCFGLGMGSYKIPDVNQKFKTYAPNLRYEYIYPNQRQSILVDAIFLNNTTVENNVAISNSGGGIIGYADQTDKYNYTFLRVAMKALFSGDADEKKLNFFLGGLVGVVFKKVNTSYKSSTISNIPDDNINERIFGFNVFGGWQYRFRPIIIELKFGADIYMKPLVNSSSPTANWLFQTQLTGIVPLKIYKKK